MSFQIIYGKFNKAIEKIRFCNLNRENIDIVTDVFDSLEAKESNEKPIGSKQYQFNPRYYRTKFKNLAEKFSETQEGKEKINSLFEKNLEEYTKKKESIYNEKIQSIVDEKADETEIKKYENERLVTSQEKEKLYSITKTLVIEHKNNEIAQEKENAAKEIIDTIKKCKYELIKLLSVEHETAIDL